MILNETYSLSNGVKIPKLGLGTWFIKDGDAAEAVKKAVSMGYRLIDTAQAYGNETGVGEGVRTCGVPRDKLFVTSKIAAEAKSYNTAARAIDDILSKTRLSYLDLVIILLSLGSSGGIKTTVTLPRTKRFGTHWRMPIRQAS